MSKGGRYERKKPKKKNSVLKIVLIVLAVLLVLLAALAIAGIAYYKSMLSKVNYVQMPSRPTEAVVTEAVETTQARAETNAPTTEETTVETTVPPMKPEDILNVLVVGQSGRAGETAALADTMILLSVNTYTKTLTLTSFLRDTYVDLPDYMGHTCGWNKLTSCYALGNSWGGTAGAMDMTNICLENNFGVEIDYNVEINFESFIKVVDLMGGVELDLTQAEADYLNTDFYDGQTFQEGFSSLDGTDALSYARMRKAAGDNDSDIKRTSRQRYMLECLFAKLRRQSLPDIQKIINEVLPMVTTNMPADKITEYLGKILPMLTDLTVESGTCPIDDGKYRWAEEKDTPDGRVYVMVFDKGLNTKAMRAITEGESAE